jgi:hypothetical protein
MSWLSWNYILLNAICLDRLHLQPKKEKGMAKIFVRERRRVARGAGQPRFAIVAVEGLDLKVYARHIRRQELEALSASVGAEVVYLPGGDGSEGEQPGEGGGRSRRHRRRPEAGE